MMDLKSSYGRAPESLRPLMKKLGVPSTPSFSPASVSIFTSAVLRPESRHAMNFWVSGPVATPSKVTTYPSHGRAGAGRADGPVAEAREAEQASKLREQQAIREP